MRATVAAGNSAPGPGWSGRRYPAVTPGSAARRETSVTRSAERPAAGCASPFEALTLEEQIALGERLGYRESSVRAAHAEYDENGNDALCVRVDKAEDGKGVVLVDDTARA